MGPTAEFNDFVAALHVHNWYAVVAIVMMLAIQFFRTHPLTADTWQKIPEGWRFLPSVIASFSIAFVKAYLDKVGVVDALCAGVGGVVGIAVPAMGMAAALKESKLPWDGGAGGKAVLVLAFLFFPVMMFTSCTGGDTGALVARSEHLAYNTAVVAVEVLDQLAQSDAERARVERSRELLAIARQAIDAGKHENAAAAIGQALAAVKLALDEAGADGVKLPPALVVSVDEAAAIFGSGS